ncbi:S1C family serine protease [Winkia neuii]|uniref:S1C family serine protease n=1 Tax=Winkia neuii TaxID=33007 RepID=UPI00255779F5|nr:trypsin-like peptidase domain-containing protein [Winkia neuii]MDK8099350.1 trypsin-like peptidase domain-containing protein [Winkia neuii]
MSQDNVFGPNGHQQHQNETAAGASELAGSSTPASTNGAGGGAGAAKGASESHPSSNPFANPGAGPTQRQEAGSATPSRQGIGQEWAATDTGQEGYHYNNHPYGAYGQPTYNQAYRQPKQKSRPGWGALIATGVVATLIGGAGAVGVVKATSNSLGASVATQASVSQAKNTKATDWETVAKKVTPAVVAIQVSDGQSAADGSGVIFDSAGHILTNHHVIANAAQGGRIAVTTASGEIFEAEVVGTDPTTDLAVLKPINPPKDLQMAKLGASSGLTVGQPVAAIGNPLGYSSTMTTGVISALDRPVSVQQESSGFKRGEQVVTNAIQVDAAVNPGNSGGPLFNASGEVIGINSSIASLSDSAGESSGSIGLGFAIPIDLAKQVSQQLLQKGKVLHAYIGVMVTNGSARVDGTIRAGAKIAEVLPGQAASKADVKSGDVVVAVDGKSVSSGNSLIGYVRRYAPGDKVKLTLVRAGKKKDVQVTLGAQDSSRS